MRAAVEFRAPALKLREQVLHCMPFHFLGIALLFVGMCMSS